MSASGALPLRTAYGAALSGYFGTSAAFWMNLQQTYDLRIAERDHGEAIAKAVGPRAA